MSEWWTSYPEQRYWMETTDRSDLGQELFAPRGKQVYQDMVQFVQPGDVVLHWKKGVGLVGSSIAVGPIRVEDRSWAGWRGASWVMPLGEFESFDSPVSSIELAQLEDGLRRCAEVLRKAYPAFKYFPFDFFRGGPRPHQGAYLTKFPLELFEVFAIVGLDAPVLFSTETGQSAPRRHLASTGPRYLANTLLRVGVERYSVAKTRKWYEERGAAHVIELGKPYDLELTWNQKVRRVEVKGSTMTDLRAVVLTRNEVANAKSYAQTDLVVVDSICFEQDEVDGYRFSGGQLRRWADWEPMESDLDAMEYVYKLGSGQTDLVSLTD